MRGDLGRVDEILACPNLPTTRLHVFRNLRASMDANGVARFERRYPSSAGGVAGGRATFCDVRGKTNVVLTCPAVARAYIFGDNYDEIDISRSHFTTVLGCHRLTGRPATVTQLRYENEPRQLERDIEDELRRARPARLRELEQLRVRCGDPPSQLQMTRLSAAQRWLDRTHMPAKTIFSAIINAHVPRTWREAYPLAQTIDQLVDDMQIMTAAVPLHPLCCDYAAALAAAHTAPVTLRSLCLAHLDEQSLNAAADALYALGMQTGLTINYSLTIYRHHSTTLLPHDLLSAAQRAASARVQFPVTFKYLPNMRNPADLPPTLARVGDAIGAVLTSIAPPSPPSTPPASACGSPLPQTRPSSPAPSPDDDDDGAGCFAPTSRAGYYHPNYIPTGYLQLTDNGAGCFAPLTRAQYYTPDYAPAGYLLLPATPLSPTSACPVLPPTANCYSPTSPAHSALVTLPDFPAPLARAPPDAKRPACPSPAASDDSQSDTDHSVPPYLLPPIACATRRVNARCRAAPLPLHPSAFLAVSAVPARVCPTSAPLNPAPRPALPLYRRPAPHRPPTRPRPVLPSPAPQPPCSHPRMTLPGRGDCPPSPARPLFSPLLCTTPSEPSPDPLLSGAPPGRGAVRLRALRVSACSFLRSLGSWSSHLLGPQPTALRAYVRAIISGLSPRRAPPD